MKNLLFALVAILGITIGANAQDTSFGVTAGLFNADATVKFEGEKQDVDGSTGFYIGVVGDFSITEKFGIRPELLYANIDESSAIFIPVMAKIFVADGLHFQAGPQFGFSLEDLPEDTSAFDLGLGAGLGYDFPFGLFLEGRYTFQVNNSYSGDLDITAKGKYLTFGVGYKF